MANLSIIRSLCENKNISLKDLAEKIGLSEHGIQRILRTNSTKIETLEKISEVLDVDITVFFTDSEFNFKFNLNDFLENTDLKFMASRYKSFYEKLAFYKDVFVWKVLTMTISGEVPDFPYLQGDQFISKTDKQNILEIPKEMISKPFSQWKLEDIIQFRKVFNIIDAFYFMIFELNFFNIREYLQDEVVKDREVLRYYKIWQEK